VFGRATITLGIGPHSSFIITLVDRNLLDYCFDFYNEKCINILSTSCYSGYKFVAVLSFF